MDILVRFKRQFRVCSRFPGCASIRLLAFLIGLCCFAAASLAQQPPQDLGITLNVSCSDNSRPTPKTLRSPVLLSPRNHKRAYTEVSVNVALGNCANQSKLLIESKGPNDHFDLVFLQEPTQMQRGNGIKIVDWSHDGRRLLFQVIAWQYGSDAPPENEILVYDTQSDVFLPVRLDLAEHFGQGCVTRIDPLGFSPEDQVILEISAKQDYDEEGHQLQPPCTGYEGLWSYNPSSYRVKALPRETVVQHWGSVKFQ